MTRKLDEEVTVAEHSEMAREDQRCPRWPEMTRYDQR